MAKLKQEETPTTPQTPHVLLGRKVKILKMHQATNLNGHVTSSIGTKQEEVDMTITPLGVLLIYKTRLGEKVEKLVFSNNVYEVELA